MSKDSIIKCLLSLILVVYLVFALAFTSHMAGSDTCNGLYINVVDSTSRRFVTTEDIDIELGSLSENILNITHDSINTYAIERQIMALDNIEKVNCMWLNNGALRIDVTPLIPLARVFDKKDGNYYINRAGKRMQASTKHRIDVPVIVGRFSDRNISPSDAFPLLDYITENSEIEDLTSAIEVLDNGDLILIPKIKGHVVNIGDTLHLKNKFDRLKVFYKKVMPAKGWEFYDTISVKWRGQVVAKRRHARAAAAEIVVEEHEDLDDVSTMLTTSVTN